MSEMTGIVVHTDGKLTPRYWVTVNCKTVFESPNASEAIQWAIDRYPEVTLDKGTYSPRNLKIPKGHKIKGLGGDLKVE